MLKIKFFYESFARLPLYYVIVFNAPLQYLYSVLSENLQDFLPVLGAMILAEIAGFSRFEKPDKTLASAGCFSSTYQSDQLYFFHVKMEKRRLRYLRWDLINSASYDASWNRPLLCALPKNARAANIILLYSLAPQRSLCDWFLQWRNQEKHAYRPLNFFC